MENTATVLQNWRAYMCLGVIYVFKDSRGIIINISETWQRGPEDIKKLLMSAVRSARPRVKAASVTSPV